MRGAPAGRHRGAGLLLLKETPAGGTEGALPSAHMGQSRVTKCGGSGQLLCRARWMPEGAQVAVCVPARGRGACL